jgi:hypothetical protein
MDLFLRRVIHPQSRDNYRVVVKDGGDEIEVGSIGVRFDGWSWGNRYGHSDARRRGGRHRH